MFNTLYICAAVWMVVVVVVVVVVVPMVLRPVLLLLLLLLLGRVVGVVRGCKNKRNGEENEAKVNDAFKVERLLFGSSILSNCCRFHFGMLPFDFLSPSLIHSP